jgi:hypothetical protein
MEKEITVQIKNVWGQERIYPICEKGKIFSSISGSACLSRFAIESIKKLGFEIKVQSEII